jgi:selenocysteine lyase/cysteine desulfurase
VLVAVTGASNVTGELWPGAVELRTFGADAPRVGIVSFVLAGRGSAEVAAELATGHGIGVRDGLFCAHPLARRRPGRAGATCRPRCGRASAWAPRSSLSTAYWLPWPSSPAADPRVMAGRSRRHRPAIGSRARR